VVDQEQDDDSQFPWLRISALTLFQCFKNVGWLDRRKSSP